VLLSGANDTGSGNGSRPGGDRVGAVPVRPLLATTRRTALGGALLGLGATGCRPDRPAAGPRAGTGASATAAAAQEPDAALVDDVLAELTSLTHLTASVARYVPDLRAPAGALEDLHRAHREALGDEVPTSAPTGGPRPPAGTDAALRLLRRREQQAQRRLVDWSVAARSGALARLLASMSAGVAQQLATLPQPHPRGTGR
jgi:hypothetical protein